MHKYVTLLQACFMTGIKREKRYKYYGCVSKKYNSTLGIHPTRQRRRGYEEYRWFYETCQKWKAIRISDGLMLYWIGAAVPQFIYIKVDLRRKVAQLQLHHPSPIATDKNISGMNKKTSKNSGRNWLSKSSNQIDLLRIRDFSNETISRLFTMRCRLKFLKSVKGYSWIEPPNCGEKKKCDAEEQTPLKKW